ncbi:hypothetical protein VPH166E361_0128 [Vibrio phage 166E36-1]
MKKDKEGKLIFVNDVVVDPNGGIGFIEKFFLSSWGSGEAAKVKNGCSYVNWDVLDLKSITCTNDLIGEE